MGNPVALKINQIVNQESEYGSYGRSKRGDYLLRRTYL